jgi:uncharacterized membrane protein
MSDDRAAWMTDVVQRLGSTPALDQIAELLGRASDALGGARPALQGDWLGHPLHPAVTDLPIGFWTSAMTIDLVGFKRGRPLATRMVGLGLLCAPATFLTGLAEFGTIEDSATRRVAATHWAGNAGATALFFLSWRSRRRGHHLFGMLLGLAGGTVATGAGLLGGRLAFPCSALGDEQETPIVDLTATEPGGNGSPAVRAPGPMADAEREVSRKEAEAERARGKADVAQARERANQDS